ncbi:MAG TPA: hypothetical protein PLL82_02705 [Candidatus Aminicenantes bacterium]|nr:hypothetical protein [Candidatus Aminicenantes bacterium]HQH44506.1 hypothetical protein [Candidatus Aminicenantes bacterium]HQJ42165.1 hypothetical protein [Candidatus Aminicenantes bacterium]
MNLGTIWFDYIQQAVLPRTGLSPDLIRRIEPLQGRPPADRLEAVISIISSPRDFNEPAQSILSKSALGIINHRVHNFPPEKIRPVDPALFVLEPAVIRADLATIRNDAAGDRPSNAAGFPAVPDVLEIIFGEIPDLPARPDDETTEIAVSVHLDENIFPGLAAGGSGFSH